MDHANKIITLSFILALGACTNGGYNTVEPLNKAQATGSPYTKLLTSEYRDLANKLESASNHADALHFTRKGLASANDVLVMPEALDDWDLSDKNIVEMTQARSDLIDALENNGREAAPGLAAIAQSRFDCWAEEQEKNWGKDVLCKSQFNDALKKLKAAVPAMVATAQPPATAEEFPAPVADAAKGKIAPVQQAAFIVFFDWKKHNLSDGANDVLNAVAQELKTRQDVKQIDIAGYTDTSGSAEYNAKLSVNRANAVRDGLITRGVPAEKLHAQGYGEEDLLVKTPDNVRESANRRVKITLE